MGGRGEREQTAGSTGCFRFLLPVTDLVTCSLKGQSATFHHLLQRELIYSEMCSVSFPSFLIILYVFPSKPEAAAVTMIFLPAGLVESNSLFMNI